MSKTFFTLLIAVAFTAPAFSQTLESIRKDYNDAKAYVKEMLGPDSPAMNRLQMTTEKMYCGSGQHKDAVNIYYRVDEERDETCNTHLIYFVTHSYNWAVRNYYEEYLYDKNGNIEFIYAKDVDDNDFSETEYRIYYNAKGVMKLTVKQKGASESKFVEVYSGNTIAQKYKQKCDEYRNESEHFKKQFSTLN